MTNSCIDCGTQIGPTARRCRRHAAQAVKPQELATKAAKYGHRPPGVRSDPHAACRAELAAAIARAEAAERGLEEEREQNRRLLKRANAEYQRAEAAECALAGLREALERYGIHDPGLCNGRPCTCGLAAALAEPDVVD